MKKLLIPLLSIIFIPLIPFSDATFDLENKILLNDDGTFVIEFGENTVRQSFSEIKATPNLEFGIIQLFDQVILLDAVDDVSVRVLGKSIAIKSFDPTVIIYARNVGDNNYSINLYTVDGGFKKQTFTAALESVFPTLSESQTEDVNENIVPTQSESQTEDVNENIVPTQSESQTQTENVSEDTVIAVSNPLSTEVRRTYNLIIRIYDATINPRADIQIQEGYLEGIKVNIEMRDPDGDVFKIISGETNSKGYFKFQHQVTENIDKLGEYTFTITANNQVYEGSTFFLALDDND